MVRLGPTIWDLERDCAKLLFQPDLTDDDREWLRSQFELAGLPTPEHDVSWIQTEWVRG